MNSPSLELHYHLKNNSHAMNAFIRNRCEAEALAAFSYLAERLGVDLAIESIAHEEGGLKDVWKFVAKPEVAWPALLSVLTLLVQSSIAVWNAPPKPDKELESINKDIAKATLEEKRLAIEKARIELKRLLESQSVTPTPPPVTRPRPRAALSEPAKPAGRAMRLTVDSLPPSLAAQLTPASLESSQLSPSTEIVLAVGHAISIVADEPKFITRRSNFFKALLPYDKVTAFGLRFASPQQRGDEVVIEKKNFFKYVLKTDKLPPVMIAEAVIDIVAPVIDGSDKAWRGTYEGAPIAFFMKDKAFKEQVLRREVGFQHGDAIRCSLVIDRKLDETGEVVVTSRSVDVVIEKIDERGAVETPQGKRRRFDEKNARGQRDLDLGTP